MPESIALLVVLALAALLVVAKAAGRLRTPGARRSAQSLHERGGERWGSAFMAGSGFYHRGPCRSA